jgi:cytosine/adenosine deaminase-related metal-dependent hydrolase
MPQAFGQEKRSLPARGQYLIRNAHVLTMDRNAGDIAGGDVHVLNGEIVAVGARLSAAAAKVIDGRGMIVLPGLVETHWHMWNSLLRSMSGDERKFGYFPTSAGLGRHFLPSEMYAGTRLAAAEALFSGITTVHDWCHNPRTPEHADENLRALRESGIRARFSYGPARGIPITETVNLADIERLHRDWRSYSNENLLTLGLAWRGVQYAVTSPDGKMEFKAIPEEVYRKEYDAARSLGIPISAHVNIGPKVDFGHVAALDKLGLLYPGLQLIHMISSTPEEVQAVAKAGCSVSLSPYTELRIGFGFPNASQYLDAGVPVGLSVDTTTLSGDANMFAIMKAVQNVDNAAANNEFKLTARRALEMGTILGAKSLGLDDRIGSLTKGKRADLIMVDTRDLNLGVFTDPAHLIVEAAQPANVALVMVDGRILKERGRLTAIDTKQVVAEANAANMAVRKRAGWW